MKARKLLPAVGLILALLTDGVMPITAFEPQPTAVLSHTLGDPDHAQASRHRATQARVTQALCSTPGMFIENVGQFPADARFQVYGAMGGSVWLTEDAIWITLLEPPSSRSTFPNLRDRKSALPSPDVGRGVRGEGESRRGVNLKLSFVGASSQPRIEPFDRLDTRVSYFIGNDPTRWHADVPVWSGVRYKDLYPGIDLELTNPGGQWQPHIVAHPGADLSAVRLRVDGADAMALDGYYLCLATATGEYTMPLFQLVSDSSSELYNPTIVMDEQVLLPFSYAISRQQLSVANSQLGASDTLYLFHSTFLGGSNDDGGCAIAVDGMGNTYVTGYTHYSDFPITPGTFDTGYNGSYDIFVVKVNAAGTELLYATFLGGSNDDEGRAIAVDGAGNAYVTGYTGSSDFPTTPGAFDVTPNGNADAFEVKVNSVGTGLLYATFLGGGDYDDGWAIAVDGAGNAYVTGITDSSDFPTTPGAFDTTRNGGTDAFVVKVNPAGTGLLYATFFLGGSAYDYSWAITVDGAGNAYMTGRTGSSNFPTTPGTFDTTHNGGDDAFVVKLNPSGSALAYATFLGGSHSDSTSIAVDWAGNAYVTGITDSSDFPTTPGAFDTTHNGGTDAFVVKVNPAGIGLLYATFLGGSIWDNGEAIAVDGAGNAYVIGQTCSSDFPTTPGAFDTSLNGDYDTFVVKVNPAGTELLYATFLGGSSWDHSGAIAVDGADNAYVTGFTISSDFPITLGAFDTSLNGGRDAFVAKMGEAYSISGRITDGNGSPMLSVVVSDGAGHSSTTQSNGNFTLSGLAAGTYTLIPSKDGYFFSPPSRTVKVPPNATEQDFTGAPFTDWVYLPLLMRDCLAYFEGPWEAEPNNSYLEANGPLRSGQNYYGYPNDEKDYFSIYLPTAGLITIDLTNHTGQGVQLLLFYQSVANLVARDWETPYHINHSGSAGWYYIYIYTESGYNSTTPYTLRVTYP